MDHSGTQGELPIPMHAAASPYGRGGAGGNVLKLHHEHGNNNGHESQALPSPPAATEEGSSGMKRAAAAGAGTGGGGGGSAVKYRECLKNHAAAMGGNATDGCGEFMPSGDEGSLEALKCSACGCHRNFHRKEVDDDIDADAEHGYSYRHHAGRRLIAPAMPQHKNGLLVTADPYGAYATMGAVPPPPPGHPLHHHQFVNATPLSVMHTSESDEMDGGGRGSGSSSSKKRFRTKFTAEQKARMLDFAERVGWRLQKLDDGMVQAFCQKIGVKRRVLKVWMHNNKHNLATKRLEAPPEAPMPATASPPPPQMPMVPPPPSSSQHGPSFRHGGPSSPPPQMPMPTVTPPPPFHRGPVSLSPPPPPFHRGPVSLSPPPPFHRSPGSPPPLKLD